MVRGWQNHWKTIVGNGALKKNITIASFEKKDHRWSLHHTYMGWARALYSKGRLCLKLLWSLYVKERMKWCHTWRLPPVSTKGVQNVSVLVTQFIIWDTLVISFIFISNPDCLARKSDLYWCKIGWGFRVEGAGKSALVTLSNLEWDKRNGDYCEYYQVQNDDSESKWMVNLRSGKLPSLWQWQWLLMVKISKPSVVNVRFNPHY